MPRPIRRRVMRWTIWNIMLLTLYSAVAMGLVVPELRDQRPDAWLIVLSVMVLIVPVCYACMTLLLVKSGPLKDWLTRFFLVATALTLFVFVGAAESYLYSTQTPIPAPNYYGWMPGAPLAQRTAYQQWFTQATHIGYYRSQSQYILGILENWVVLAAMLAILVFVTPRLILGKCPGCRWRLAMRDGRQSHRSVTVRWCPVCERYSKRPPRPPAELIPEGTSVEATSVSKGDGHGESTDGATRA